MIPTPPTSRRSPAKRLSRKRQLERGLTRIRLGGALGRKYGQEHAFAVSTPAEAIAALEANFPGFKDTVTQLKGYDFIVRAGRKVVSERAYRARQHTGAKTISFVPVARGSASSKGILTAIAGVVLVVAGVALAAYGGGVIAAYGANLLIGAGVSLALSGVASLISGTPKVSTDSQSKRAKPNAQFDGPQIVTEAGAPIAVIYGELIVGGNLISESIQSVDVKVSYESTSPNIVAPDVTVTPGAGASFHAVGGSSGGGSSSSAGAREVSDTLHSTQYAKLQILHGVGPVEGIVGGMQGVFVEQTPFQNPDGTGNFRNWTYDFRDGSPDQDFIAGFDSSENPYPIGVEIKADYPLVRHIADTAIDALRVEVRYPSLVKTSNKNGGRSGAEVEIEIAISQNGGAWQVMVGHENGGYIKGKGTAYTRSYEIQLPQAGPWDVRVRRITPDSTSVYLENKTFVDSFTEITYVKLSHPNRCKSAIQVDAQQFSSIPKLAVKLRGRKVRVPTNYDPIARTYANNGQWDGTFKTAWTNNPAWIFFDFATDSTFGAGNEKAETGGLKWELYNCARYNDQLVPDGNGGQEPRYACNCMIAQAQETPRVLSDIASSMGAGVYFRAGEIGVSQDRPRTYTAKQFLPENVENGLFSYVGTAKDARHNLARVRFNDPGNFYATDVEPYEDGEALSLDDNLFNPLDVTAFGCTSRGAAYRRGRYSIVTEQYEGEVCTLTTGLDAADLTPGDVIQTFNPFRSGVKDAAGRIKAVLSPTVIQLDRAPNAAVLAGASPKFCFHYQGTNGRGEPCTQVASIPIDAGSTAGDILHLAAAPSETPLPMQAWGILSGALKPELWRVLAITHEGGLRHTVTGHRYNASKFDAIDLGFSLVAPNTSLLPNAGVCLPPGPLTVVESTTATPAGIVRSLDISCEPSPDPLLAGYAFSYRYGDGNWVAIEETPTNHTTLSFAIPGDFEIRVCAFNRSLHVPSSYVSTTYSNADGSPLPALSVSGLELTGQAHDLVNEEPDFHFAWRLNSPALAAQVGGDGAPLSAGMQDPTFGAYLIQVQDAATGEQVWTDTTGTPDYTFDRSMNSKAFGGAPHPTIIFGVAVRDAYGKVGAWSQIQVGNPAPPPPEALAVSASLKGLHAEWRNPKAPDLATIELLLSSTGALGDAQVLDVGLAQSKGVVGLPTGGVYRLWVRAVDTFGNRSNVFPSGAGVTVVIGSVQATDIDDFAVDASKMFTNTIVLQGDLWTNNSPSDGSVAWNAHSVFFGGREYPVAAGSTALGYVWWRKGDAAYRTSDANPADVDGWSNNADFQIARNRGGVYERAWTGLANAVIGSAYIMRAAIGTAHIQDAAIQTAKIGLAQVDTLQIAGQAVTIPASVQGADVGFQDWTTAVALTVPSTGAPAMVLASWGHSLSDLGATDSDYRIVRTTDALTIYQNDFTASTGTETQTVITMDPATISGAATYELQVRASNRDRTTFYAGTARKPTLLYLEVKR